MGIGGTFSHGGWWRYSGEPVVTAALPRGEGITAVLGGEAKDKAPARFLVGESTLGDQFFHAQALDLFLFSGNLLKYFLPKAIH